MTNSLYEEQEAKLAARRVRWKFLTGSKTKFVIEVMIGWVDYVIVTNFAVVYALCSGLSI